MTEEAAEFHGLADLLAGNRNDANGRRLVVDHADCCFICNHGTDRFSRRIARNGNHVESDRANRRHGFKLGKRQRAGIDGIDHPGIFGNGDECARQSADVTASHDAALFNGIVEHGKSCRRTVSSDLFKTDFFQNLRNGIPNGRRRCKRQIDDAKRNAETF